MKINFAEERVLAVVAHPDDADCLCAGTLARAKAEGATIGICVLCQGDKGQPATPVPDLAVVRRKEMGAAAAVLGAELFFGEIPDGELADVPQQRKRLIEILRRFKPTLVLAHAADDYHADHRAAGALAEAASWFCASAGHQTPGVGPVPQPAVWWMDTINMVGFTPALFIDISAYVEVKQRMLRCHASQLQRGQDGDFSPLEEQIATQARARGIQAGVAAAEAFRPYLAWKRARAW